MTLTEHDKRRTLRIAVVALVGFAAAHGVARAQNIGVFVSSEATDGSIDEMGFATGLASADAICDRVGTAAIAGSGLWVAWLSDMTADARDRVPVPGPAGDYVRATDQPTVIAADLADLTDGMLDNSVGLDESGSPGATFAWTGTLSNGTAQADRCNDWTSGAFPGPVGTVGGSSATDATWTNLGQGSCATPPASLLFRFGAAAGPDRPTRPAGLDGVAAGDQRRDAAPPSPSGHPLTAAGGRRGTGRISDLPSEMPTVARVRQRDARCDWVSNEDLFGKMS